jgi:hypothetical protein
MGASPNSVASPSNSRRSRPRRTTTTHRASSATRNSLALRSTGGNTCVAGLLTQLGSPGTCGIHPSYAGQALLAQALEKVVRF